MDSGHGIKELRAFRHLAPRHRVLFDVGAAEGIFSAAFCAMTGGLSKAFEPSPVMFRRLLDLRAVNRDLDIRAINTALGDTPGMLRARPYSDGQFSAVGDAGDDWSEMSVATLDDVVREDGTAPDLVKVDVEGMELAVVRGGSQTLATSVRTIFLEVHYDAMAQRGESPQDLQGALADLGFRLWSLDLVPIPDLAAYLGREREMVPGYAIVIGRKTTS
jgi:FkbM family methyltransferase